MLLHSVPFFIVEGIPDPQIEAEVHRQLSPCRSLSSLGSLQGEKVSIFFLVDLSRKNRKLCKSEILGTIPDSGRNASRHSVSS